jgi:Phage tail sheath protein subtilisin-like domain/Phage tail sheath C-terminal domain
MATPQLSPGVLTREVDLTVGRAENVLDNIGGIAGPFEIGPVNEPITVATEQELINNFGKPQTADNQYEYWMSASSYLSYGGVLKVVRTDGSNLANSNVGVGTTSVAGVKIKNFDDFNSNFSNSASNFYYAAKNPGTWANGLKVCYIDDFGDQILGIATTSVTSIGARVGYAVTVDISGKVIPGAGTTEVFNGYLKGVITQAIDGPETGVSALVVKIHSRVSTGGTQPGRHYRIDYSQNSDFSSFLKDQRVTIIDNNGLVVSPTDSISAVGITSSTAINGQQGQTYTGVGGTTAGTGSGATFTITRNNTDGNVATAVIVNAGLGYTVGDTVSIAGTAVGGYNLSQGVINTIGLTTAATVVAASNGVYLAVAGVSTVGSGVSFNVYRNSSGGIGTVTMVNPGSGYGSSTVVTIPGASIGGVTPGDNATLTISSLRNDRVVLTVTNSNSRVLLAGVDDWYDSQTLGLNNSTIYWRTVAPKPGTSSYVAERGGNNDEMHVIVVDDDGKLTGIKGNILEKHLFMSKAKDTVSQVNSPQKMWYKNYLANYSNYIYAGANQSTQNDLIWNTYPTSTNFNWTASRGIYSFGDHPTTFAVPSLANLVWDRDAKDAWFSSVGRVSYDLANGKNYTTQGNLKSTLGSIIEAYDLFNNKEDVSVDYLLMGPGLDSITDSQAKANKLISIAEGRRDCIAVVSPHRASVVDLTNPVIQTNNIIQFFGPLQSSSYAVFDSGYKYTYDRFNNLFRYIPCNADIAGLMARTNLTAYPWFSPAGQQRGVLKNAIKLAYNPNKTQRDSLYSARINSIVNQPGSGILLFGDKTALSYASAFDRINVRRLFLTVEQSLERAAEAQLFEFNDQITRANFVNIVEPYLRDIQAKRGIYDFLVICDETNNTPDIIDNNEFRADIFLKPAKSINYITLTFVATRTGVSFEEVAGRV